MGNRAGQQARQGVPDSIAGWPLAGKLLTPAPASAGCKARSTMPHSNLFPKAAVNLERRMVVRGDVDSLLDSKGGGPVSNGLIPSVDDREHGRGAILSTDAGSEIGGPVPIGGIVDAGAHRVGKGVGGEIMQRQWRRCDAELVQPRRPERLVDHDGDRDGRHRPRAALPR
jgi:hypothetical protein